MGGSERSVSNLINEILRDHFHTYALSKSIGRILISKHVVQRAIDNLPDEQLDQLAAEDAETFKEAAIIQDGLPSLDTYLKLIRTFAKANRFYVEVSKNPDNGDQVLIINLHMSERFSRFRQETYKRLLEEFAEIDRVETIGSVIYFEFKPKKEVLLQSA